MDYNKLHTFLRVAERGSVTAAAVELGRTQSAVTQQIKLLEEELGFALLERRHARIFLTPQAERLIAVGRRSLGSLDDEVARLKDDLQAVEGSLAVGALDDYGTASLGPALAGFCARHPRVQLRVEYGTSAAVEEMLIENRVDVGVLVNFRDRSLFEVCEVAVEHHVPVASRLYLQRRGPLHSVEQMVEEADFLDFSEEFHCLRTWVGKNRKALLPALLKRRPALALQSHAGLKSILVAGFGVALMPRYLIDGDLVELFPSLKPVRVGHDAAYRKKRTLRLVERLFLADLSGQSLAQAQIRAAG